METTLEILNPDGTNKQMECPTLLTIGREEGNALRLEDPLLSRNHCIIRCDNSKSYVIMDVGSRNGVFVNNRRINAPLQLQDGDIITLGDTLIKFFQVINLEKTRAELVATQAKCMDTMQHDRATVRPLTILVCDIRSFTTLSERTEISYLTRFMSVWFDSVEKIIRKNGGEVDKFIGDCVLAKWEIDKNKKSHVRKVLRTACNISSISQRLYKEFPELALPIRTGAGIATGYTAVDIGLDNTILGDTVNTAFRLENASKDLVTDIVMNKGFFVQHPRLKENVLEETIKVKGKDEMLNVGTMTFDLAEMWLHNFEDS